MKAEIISKKTRNEFREYLTQWYLGQIDREFDAVDIECRVEYSPPVSGQRRARVEQYYKSLDFTDWNDVQKLLRAYENILEQAAVNNPDSVPKLCAWLRKDGFEYQEGRIISLSKTASVPHAKQIAREFGADYMSLQILRMDQSVEIDPALAVGSAKELIETCCKTILKDRNVGDHDNLDLPQLVRTTLRELNLLPDGISDRAKGVETIRRVLFNLASVTHGLAELRNLYGSGHGRDGRSLGLKPRHAKLAVGAAAALTVFLFETHRDTLNAPNASKNSPS
jgi:hypothetical protein